MQGEREQLTMLWENLQKYFLVCFLPGGVFPEKFSGDARSASQNPYPIEDQHLRFSLLYLCPDQKFDILFMTVATGTIALSIICEGLFLIVVSIMMKKQLLKSMSNLRLQCKNHILAMTKMSKIDTLLWIFLQVPEHDYVSLRKTKEIKDRKQNNSK